MRCAHSKKGKFEIVKVGSMKIGRAGYEPGWKLTADFARRADSRIADMMAAQ